MAATARSISRPVGPWEDAVIKKKNGNPKGDIITVQKLLISASKQLDNTAYNPGSPDGRIAKAPRNSNTLNAIGAFQRRFLKKPDRRIDLGGTTWKNLAKHTEDVRTRTLTIDSRSLISFCQAMMDGHCSYGFGSKARPLSKEPSTVTAIDCSGFVRYLLYQVTDGRVTIPDGSWNQDAWFRNNRFEQVDYADAKNVDGTLRLGYFSGSPGHIWFIRNGRTIESNGGRGPNRRPWDHGPLKMRVMRCFVLARMPASLESVGGVIG